MAPVDHDFKLPGLPRRLPNAAPSGLALETYGRVLEPITPPCNMARPHSVRCAALVLLHICLMTAAAGIQPLANPRGWQAARQAEQRAAAAAATAAAGWAQLQGDQPEGLPAGACQQTCGFTQLPVFPAPRAAGWLQLAAAFLGGMLASALLQYWLQLRRRRRRGQAAAGAGEVQHNQIQQQREPREQPVKVERLEPAGSEAGPAPAAPAAGARPTPEAAGSATAATALVGAAAGAAFVMEEVEESPAAGQSAAVVAVQELVMQQSAGASGAGSSSSSGDAAAEAPGLPSGRGSPEEQQAQQQQQQQQQPGEPVNTPAGAPNGSMQGVALTQQQADIQAAGELVMSMCAALHIRPAQLLPSERLQLISTTLQVWQGQQAQQDALEMRRCAVHVLCVSHAANCVPAQSAPRCACPAASMHN